MEFKFKIEDKEFIINTKNTEDYKIVELTKCKTITIYPVWFKIVGISNNKKFSGLIGVSQSIFEEGNDFLNKYINDTIKIKFEELLITNKEW